MDEDRLRWITRKPNVTGWEVSIDYAEVPGDALATVLVRAKCNRKRGWLWSYSETLPRKDNDYALHDFLCHIALVIDAERPTTKEAFGRAMRGETWEQPTLPF